MRPHVTFHRDAEALSTYDLRANSSPEILGGSLIANSIPVLRNLMELSMPVMVEDRFFHVTLSAPDTLQLDRETWLTVAEIVLLRLSIPGQLTPHIVVRHTNEACDHIHIFCARFTFAGRILEPSCSVRRTNETHQILARRLGLPVPYYFDATSGVRLAGHVPARRTRGDIGLVVAAADINAALEMLPRDFLQFNQFLEKGEVKPAENAYGTKSFQYRNQERAFFLGRLGPEFEPRVFRARLAQAANIRRALLALELRAHLGVTTKSPELLQQIEDHHTQMRKPRTNDQNHDQATHRDGTSTEPASNSATDGRQASTAARLVERGRRARSSRQQLDQYHPGYSDESGGKRADVVRDRAEAGSDRKRSTKAGERYAVSDRTVTRSRRRGVSWIVEIIRLARSISLQARFVFRRRATEIDVCFPDRSEVRVCKSDANVPPINLSTNSNAGMFVALWNLRSQLPPEAAARAITPECFDDAAEDEAQSPDPNESFGM